MAAVGEKYCDKRFLCYNRAMSISTLFHFCARMAQRIFNYQFHLDLIIFLGLSLFFIGVHANNGLKGKYANGTVTTSHARHVPHSNIESMYTLYSITIEQTTHNTTQHNTTQQEQNNLTEAKDEE